MLRRFFSSSVLQGGWSAMTHIEHFVLVTVDHVCRAGLRGFSPKHRQGGFPETPVQRGESLSVRTGAMRVYEAPSTRRVGSVKQASQVQLGGEDSCALRSLQGCLYRAGVRIM